MPEDSSWKTPRVSARWSMSKVSGSSMGMAERSRGGLWLATMLDRVSSSTERVRSPRKSIFTRPRCSMGSMEYWVTTWFSPILRTGTISTRGTGVITTPAACWEQCRAIPSMWEAVSMS